MGSLGGYGRGKITNYKLRVRSVQIVGMVGMVEMV
jgi:hypothetical protein